MKILSFLTLFHLISCSLAPVTTTKQARTLGKDNWQLDAALLPVLGGSIYRGFSENFDAGITLESQLSTVIAAGGKYAFINNQTGSSLALLGGVFYSPGFADASGAYLGPLYSYKNDWFEPYIGLRYNYVNWSAVDLTSDERDDLFFDLLDIGSTNFGYLQLSLGSNFWIDEKFAITINAHLYSFVGNDIEDETFILPGIEFTFLL